MPTFSPYVPRAVDVRSIQPLDALGHYQVAVTIPLVVTQAANDLNITFVIDEAQGDRMVTRLHEIAIRKMTADRVLGPTWEELYGTADKTAIDPHGGRDDLRRRVLRACPSSDPAPRASGC